MESSKRWGCTLYSQSLVLYTSGWVVAPSHIMPRQHAVDGIFVSFAEKTQSSAGPLTTLPLGFGGIRYSPILLHICGHGNNVTVHLTRILLSRRGVDRNVVWDKVSLQFLVRPGRKKIVWALFLEHE
jgi:hypothetical protein